MNQPPETQTATPKHLGHITISSPSSGGAGCNIYEGGFVEVCTPGNERIANIPVEQILDTARLTAANVALVAALEPLLSLCDLEDRHGRLVIKEDEKKAARAAIAAQGRAS